MNVKGRTEVGRACNDDVQVLFEEGEVEMEVYGSMLLQSNGQSQQEVP